MSYDGVDNDDAKLPKAPPDQVRTAISTLLSEWQKVQTEKARWNFERAQMRARILQLEGESRIHEKVRMDLIRRIKLLEHGLMQERANYLANAQPSVFASNLVAQAVIKPSTSMHRISGPSRQQGRAYHTLPSNFGKKGTFLAHTPGRQFLREYLIELGYLKEAAQLDLMPRKAVIDEKSDEPPVRMRPAPVQTSAAEHSVNDWKVGNSPPAEDVKVSPTGSFAKPSKPSKAIPKHPRRGSMDEKIVDAIGGERQWKPTVTLRSHLDGVRSLSWHSDQPVLLTGSEDGTVKLWNIQSLVSKKGDRKKKVLEPRHTFRGHVGMVTSVVLADTFGRCVSAGVDGKIFVWNMPPVTQNPYDRFGECTIFKDKVLEGHTDAVWSLAVHPSKTMPLLFSASADGFVRVWDINEYKELRALEHSPFDADKKNRRIPTSVCVEASDPKKLLAGYDNGDLLEFDIETGKTVRVFKSRVDAKDAGQGQPHITDIASHPSLGIVLTAHSDENIRIFDLSQGACVEIMHTHRDVVSSVSIDPSGLYFGSGSHDQSIRFWDMSSKKIIQDLDGYQTHRKKYDEAVHCVRHHPTQPLVASGGADSVIKVYQ